LLRGALLRYADAIVANQLREPRPTETVSGWSDRSVDEQGAIDPAGVGFAAGAAVGWGAYIVLTQRVGDRFTGIQGLALTVPIAALTTAVVGIPQAAGHLSLGVIAASIGLALLFPVLPFALEMAALRRMTQRSAP
jgi:threonine/homoserine efflux transporter RhtA